MGPSTRHDTSIPDSTPFEGGYEESSREVTNPDTGKPCTETKELHSGDGGGANWTYTRTDKE